jgi:hypothetical protein
VPGPRSRHLTGLWLFLAVLFLYSICPPFTSYDSYWSVPTALSIIRHGSTAVDEFVPSAPPDSHDGLECVPAVGPPVRYGQAHGCPGGHWYSFHPIGVPVLALPLIFLLKIKAAFWGPLLPKAGPLFAQPVIAAFFSGDLVAGRSLAELWCASTFGAIAVALQYRIASRFLPRRPAVWLALLFAFGTSEWSVASRNLLPHGLSVLLLSAALYLALIAREEPSRIRLAGLALALAFTVRPSNAISAAVFTLYVAVHYRRYLAGFLLWTLPAAVPFFVYNLVVRHSLIPLYVRSSPERYPALAGLAMHLFSPSRGLIVFTPIVLFSVAGMILAWRLRWCWPLAPYLVAIVVLHTALIVSIWPGHGYGPRYFADITHLLILFLIPALLYWRAMRGPARTMAAGLFLLLAAWGVFAHGRGGTSTAANQWSALPVNVDQAKWRVWDWSDPQFLRGLR